METQWATPSKIILQREIGRGSFGVVHKAIWRNRLVAVKTFDAQTELIAYEAHFLSVSRLRHPNIITLFAVSFDKQWKYLIMQYAENGSLHDLVHGVREYSRQQAFELALQCAEGVAYLHNMKEPIILLYMNPQSLLLTDNFSKLKISNIGRLTESRARADIDRSFCPYLAPEVFEGLTCDEKCDVFSWAIIVWELLTRKRPYNEFKDNNALHYHKSIGVRPPLCSDMIDNLKLLLVKCWSNFHKDRPSMHLVVCDSVKILSHIVNLQIIRKDNKRILPIGEIDSKDISDYKHITSYNGIFDNSGVAMWRDRSVFVKTFEYSSVGTKSITITSLLLTRIRHPNIIELFGYTFDWKIYTMSLIFDKIEYGSLYKHIYDEPNYTYTPTDALDWSLQCAQGVAYMHNMKPESLFRANLNPRAVMLTSDRRQVKLCEFTTDIYLTDFSKQDICAYMAPEIMNGQRYSNQSDVFSWAILMWELLKREPPSTNESLQLNENWPEDFKHVFFLCWSKRAEERPCMTNVVLQMEKIIRIGVDFENSIKDSGNITKIHHFFNMSSFNEIQIESIIQKGICRANWNNQKVVVTYGSDSEINSNVRRLLHVSHPNIIQIFGVSLSSNSQKCLISEFSQNGTLHDYLYGVEEPHYPWQQALSWAKQCAAGIAYLHGIEMCSFLHPYLMPCKILLTNQFCRVKIFKFISNFEALNEYQPIGFIAPEVFETLSYTKECDVFSWGILLCEILTRRNPLYHRLRLSILKWFGRSLLVIVPDTKDLPKCVKDLIYSCTASDPQDRPTIDKVISELNELDIKKFKTQTSYHTDKKAPTTLNTNIDTINTEQTIPEWEFKEINIEKTLGRGSFGTVHKAKWCMHTVAMKEIDTSTDDLKKVFKAELQQLMRVSHRNIIKVFATSSNDHLKYILIEYAKNGSLENVLYSNKKRRYSEGRALNWALQCAEGIAYLHNLKPLPVMHRDLKPQNLLITRRGRRLKICDFGTVVELKTRMTTNQGTAHYMAPEVFEGGKYTEKCDVFSWAIILWEILKRERPYKELENVHAVQYQKVSKGRRPPIPEEWKKLIKDLIASGWNGEPHKRPSMKDAVSALKKIISQCVGIPSYMESRQSRMPTIPYSDLKIDKTPICQNYFGYIWNKRSVIIQKNLLETFENMKVFIQLTENCHQNIIKLFATTSNGNITYLVVEHAKNGNLDNFLHGNEKRSYSKTRALSWALQLAEGILHLHSMKPRAFLLSKLMPQYLLLTKSWRQLKISLYGEGVLEDTSTNNEMYLAPEALYSEEFTEQSNVFSWGIILWEMMKREKPYKLQRNNYAIQLQKLKDERPSLPDKWEDSIKNLLPLCWSYVPNERLTMTDIVAKMKDILNKPKASHTPKFINQSVLTPKAQIKVFRLRTLPDAD